MSGPLCSAAERAALIASYRKSGLTQRQFAERAGIAVTTLRCWLYKPGRAQKTTAFVRVEAVEHVDAGIVPVPNQSIRLDIGDSLSLHLHAVPAPEYLARLARELAC